MWYLVKCLLKVLVDEVHCFVVTSVVGVNDTGKEVKKFVSAISAASTVGAVSAVIAAILCLSCWRCLC